MEFITKTNKSINIISPSLNRLDEILSFVEDLAKEDTFLSFHPEKIITRKEEEIWLKNTIKSIEAGSAFVYWAVFDGKIVGSVDVHRGASVRDWHVGTIGLMVAKDFRGEGLGKFLLETIIEKAKEMGIKTVILDVFSDNEIARNLYRKVGFKEFGVLPQGLYRQKNFSDRIYMYKEIYSSSPDLKRG